ncbi:hypothetical protein [Candidatus Sneabacter namystus]|uniref:ATP synthase F1 complex delta/epsilon subunit N-terminal domain-containing protein n=1 Tax=Candidatus Sneabacter namystus TaxID=2601646 RepID=A0A5C0UHL2_9RICK|nr:hypothetical protein [Candidatus Sneabacter namystus]QEK39506.1 hypothetical protein FZC37_00950 [Candidatus Sneabacter namystus]
MLLNIFSYHKSINETNIKHIIVRGVEGEFCVMQEHESFYASVKDSILDIKKDNGKSTSYAVVGSCLCAVGGSKVTIFSELLYPVDSSSIMTCKKKLQTLHDQQKNGKEVSHAITLHKNMLLVLEYKKSL